MKKAALIVGGNAAGIQAALDLADSQLEVYLVERSPTLCAQELASDDALMPPLTLLTPKMLAVASHPNIHVLTNAEVVRVGGEDGDLHVSIRKYPRFVVENKCTGCGRCELKCPVNVENRQEPVAKAVRLPNRKAVPYVAAVDKQGVSPCRLACPGGVNPHGYVALISQGRYAEALRLILDSVPLPGVLGRVCSRPCEPACNRRELDEPIAICSLKRFVADEAWNEVIGASRISSAPSNSLVGSAEGNRQKVAVAGSGPAGLSAAWMLARMGYAVTIFESMPEAGGMLSACIPEFRLPRDIVRREIEYVRSLGVDIRTSVTVGRDVSLDQLRDQGFEAVFLAIGAHRSRTLGIPGETLAGVVDCISLLKDVSKGHGVLVGKKVAIIGGGNAAIDAARTAVRLKADSVRILYRRSRAEMPANEEEIREAEKEGVEILPLVVPKRILGEGRVTGVECLRCEIEGRDSDGRGRPVIVPESEFVVDADAVILAIGQEVDFSTLPESLRAEGSTRVIPVDSYTLSTCLPGVFAGGDAVLGASTVIEAIASGKRAAESIDRYLRRQPVLAPALAERAPARIDLVAQRGRRANRQVMPSLSLKERIRSFDEVELGFAPEMALREAQRCLNCAGCSECMQCVQACEVEALNHFEQEQTFEIAVGAIVPAVALEARTPQPPDEHDALAEDYEPFLRGSAAAVKAMASLARYRPMRRFASRDVAEHTREMTSSGFSPLDGTAHQRFSIRGSLQKRVIEFGAPPANTDAAIVPDNVRRVGVFLCECGGQISDRVDLEELRRRCRALPYVAYVRNVRYVCSESYKKTVLDDYESHDLSLGIVAACACCSLDQICYACTHNKIRCKSGLAHMSFEFVNIREQCAFVHADTPALSAEKAAALIEATLARCADEEIAQSVALPVNPVAVVMGSGLAGIEAAVRISAQGFETHLVSTQRVDEVSANRFGLERVKVHSETRLASVAGQVGSYETVLVRKGEVSALRAGVIIIDGGSADEATVNTVGRDLLVSAEPARGWLTPNSSTGLLPPETKVPGVYYCPSTRSGERALTFGAAAASKASVLLGAGRWKMSPIVASVVENRCRWCGECQRACAFSAISIIEGGTGDRRARVNPALCSGCGICVPRCNTRAIDLSPRSTGSGNLASDEAAASRAAAVLVSQGSGASWMPLKATASEYQPRIVVLTCNWEAYSAVEDAGALRKEYSASIRVLRLPCLGRISSNLILEVIRQGADGVMLLACPEDRCHYESGSALAEKSFEEAVRLLDAAGISADRLEFSRLPVATTLSRSGEQLVQKLQAFERRLARIQCESCVESEVT